MAFRPIRPTISYQNDSISFKRYCIISQDIKYVSVKYKNRGKIRNI